MAIGDFDCDGQPDVAVGFPKVTYNQAPYNSQNSETGIVKVYYSYAVDGSGAFYSKTNKVQVLSFRDLPAYAHFGQSLSSGNINRDVSLVGLHRGNVGSESCENRQSKRDQ